MELERILKKLNNNFVVGFEDGSTGEYREIFVNPTEQEIMQLKKDSFDGSTMNVMATYADVRFLALKNKKEVYVASGDVLHPDILIETGLNTEDYEEFCGLGKIEGKKITANKFSDVYEMVDEKYYKKQLKMLINGEYDWMENYNILLSELKKKAKEEIKRIK